MSLKYFQNLPLKIFSALFVFASPMQADWFALNMTRGVTDISNEVFELHMLIFWICVAIGVVVFSVMFYSMYAHTKKKNPVAASFHENHKLEIAWTIVPFLILILVVVFIHEYGHYYFARKYGVGVTDFSIGFGKELFGWNDKSGTRWKICWIPLGGYVKFFGDRNVFSQADQEKLIEKYNEEDRKKLFVLKPLYQRALIVFGGPLANFLLALLIFFSIHTFAGKDFTPAMINEVQKDSPAMIGGLKQNDIILEIDGNEVKSIMDVSKFITLSTDDFIDFKVKRSYDEMLLKVKPKMVLSEDNLGNKIKKRN